MSIILPELSESEKMDAEIMACWQAKAGMLGEYRSKNLDPTKTDKDQHYQGNMAEVAFCKYYDLYWWGGVGKDPGYDCIDRYGRSVDIKSSHGRDLMTPYSYQFKSDILVHMSFNGVRFEIVGWQTSDFHKSKGSHKRVIDRNGTVRKFRCDTFISFEYELIEMEDREEVEVSFAL